jgi:hypothetical protein
MALLFDMNRLHHGCGESLRARSFMMVITAAEEGCDEQMGHGSISAETGGGERVAEAESGERLWG